MVKKTIKLNESQLRNMVAESVKKVLKEDVDPVRQKWNTFIGQFYQLYQTIDDDNFGHEIINAGIMDVEDYENLSMNLAELYEYYCDL